MDQAPSESSQPPTARSPIQSPHSNEPTPVTPQAPPTSQAPPGSPAQPDQPQVPQKPQPSGGKPVFVIILVIFVGLIILGVGGFFVVRYYFKKSAEKAKQTLQNVTQEDSTNEVTSSEDWPSGLPVQANDLRYQMGKVTKVSENTASGARAIIEMQTSDSVNNVNSHYLLLMPQNNWTLIRNETAPEGNTAIIDLEAPEFTTDIEIVKSEIVGEGTKITVTIFLK